MGKNSGDDYIMKTMAKFLPVFFVVFLFLLGCGDGVNRSRPQFGIAPLNPLLTAPLLQCVDVTDYRHITVSENEVQAMPAGSGVLPPAAGVETGQRPQIGFGRRYPAGMGSLDAMKSLVAKAAVSGRTVADEEIQDCIEDTIKSFKKCGRSCSTYWGSATWLLSRERVQKKPKSSEVQILNFTGCEQVEKARCLLTD